MKNLLIAGSPGSGKTTRLIDLYSEHLEKGETPDTMAFVSFTRAVANQASTKISKRMNIPYDNLRKGNVATLHGLALRLLRQEFDVRVITPKDTAWKFLQFIRDTKNFSETPHEKEILLALVTLYEMFKERKPEVSFLRYCNPELQKLVMNKTVKWTVATARTLYHEIEFEKTYDLFCDWRMVQETLYLTFTELEIFLLKNIHMFKDRFSVIFLDEFQDINRIGIDILENFNTQLIFAGDSDQSIFGFRNVNPTYFLNLPNFDTEVMPITHRFDTSYAMGLERGISTFIKNRQKKDLTGVGNKINIFRTFPNKIEEGVILSRTNSKLQELSAKLIKNYIPHHIELTSIIGHKDINPFIKKFKHILIFILSNTIEEFANNISKIIRYKYYNELETDDKIEILKNKYTDYYNVFNSIVNKSLKEKVRLCQYYDKLKQQASELHKLPNVEQFIENIFNPKVLLSTVHRFKGRENKKIYLYGWENGLFPLRKNDFREEVRIAYVALSRTCEELYLSGYSMFDIMLKR